MDLPEDDHQAPVDYGSGPVASAGALTETLKELSAAGMLAPSYRPASPTRAAYRAGAFGPVFGWPVIPIHMVQLPDGRVLAYGSDDKGNQGAQLHYSVWDPNWDPAAPGAAPSPFQLLQHTTGTDLFCNTQLVLPSTGQVFMAGGDRTINGIRNYAVADTNFFNPADNSLRLEPTPMAFRRWYGTAITNARGEVVVMGGRDDRYYAGTSTKPATEDTYAPTPEVYVPGSGWRTLTGARSEAAFGEIKGNWWYPKSWLLPNGRILTITNDGYFYSLDHNGSGGIVQLNGKIQGTNWNTTSVMYAPGKILSVRGTTTVSLIDVNGPQPVISRGAPISTGRKWGFSTVLPDGTVWVNGGSVNENTLADAVYTTELWNPATNTWTMTANAAKPRLYHGNTMLLPNGAVVVGGGGAPGPVRGLNAEMYFPPYFFNPNGTWATQPVINTVSPQVFSWSDSFTLQMGSWGAIEKVVMIRTGSSTHSFSNEQRRMELDFTQAGRTLTVKAPARATEMPPGYYMVFALRKNPQAPAGETRLVPSEAKIVKLS
ncbi:galactose oxidase-like domain-containing protein [Azohydromonas aeria]|uniref:galactose oxidase-like domain-containing protein n=1 Tax=Azohydromonas aeria TaxID=2590212 RepID=UPI0012F7C720|nr:galactose oxidase-like domain-containing protein [Azohydromonas aeria]